MQSSEGRGRDVGGAGSFLSASPSVQFGSEARVHPEPAKHVTLH